MEQTALGLRRPIEKAHEGFEFDRLFGGHTGTVRLRSRLCMRPERQEHVPHEGLRVEVAGVDDPIFVDEVPVVVEEDPGRRSRWGRDTAPLGVVHERRHANVVVEWLTRSDLNVVDGVCPVEGMDDGCHLVILLLTPAALLLLDEVGGPPGTCFRERLGDLAQAPSLVEPRGDGFFERGDDEGRDRGEGLLLRRIRLLGQRRCLFLLHAGCLHRYFTT